MGCVAFASATDWPEELREANSRGKLLRKAPNAQSPGVRNAVSSFSEVHP